ncbi:MAG: AAA family ATPase [Xanthobacteraceae bacterium]
MMVDHLPDTAGRAPLGQLSGERRQVTALFYDIVGSTELLGTLDPEDYGALQHRLHSAAAEAIEAAGGHMDGLLGDGGFAYFGLPVPLEDAAEAAVACAFDVIERCGKLTRAPELPLKLRVGIATGTVVIKQTTDSRLPGAQEVVGIAPALAARLQAVAEPNGIMIADSTYRLTEGAFVYEPAGIRQLKGFAEPVRLWRPLARRAHKDRFSAGRRVSAPLIGREAELALCRESWQRACRGEGRLLILQGEAGIGKSRLLAELRQEIADGDGDVATFQCQPRGNNRPLHPFLDSLRLILVADGAEVSAASISAYFQANGADISQEHAAALALLCGPPGGEKSGAGWSSGTDAEEMKHRSRDAVLHYLTCWSGPRLIVLEDVHWADSLTEALLAQLPTRVAGRPVLVVATSRDAVPTASAANVQHLPLARLGEAGVAALLASIWPDPPAGLPAFVFERSDGVPLFAEQLAFMIKEAAPGAGSGPDIWRRLLPDNQVHNLQDLIAARLAGLGALRLLAQIASVIGRSFDADLLGRLIEPAPERGQLNAGLRALMEAGIVGPVPAARDAAFRFRHVLIHQSAYDSLLRSDRRELHGRIVQLVGSGAVAPPPDEILAWHYEQAGHPFEAARHAIRAAEACLTRSAMREAGRLLDTAQRQLELCAPADQAVTALELQLLAARGPVAVALFGRGSAEAGAVYGRAVALCRASGAEDRAQWLPLYWGWWFTAPDYETQKARAEVVVSDLEAATDPEVRLQSLHCGWASNFDAGRHAYCLHCVGEGLKLYDPDRARWSRLHYGGHDAKVCGLGERALSLWFTDDEDGSARSIGECLAFAEATGHRDSLFHALDYAVCLARYSGDHATVLQVADRMAAMAEEHDMPDGRAKALLFGGWAMALMGKVRAGRARFEEGFTVQAAIGTEENASIYQDMRAELLSHAGHYGEALLIVEQAIVASSRNGQVFWLPELLRRRARLGLALGGPRAVAVADLRRAVALAAEHGATALARRAQGDLDSLDVPASEQGP